MSKCNFFQKENYFSSKNSAGHADCSWDKLWNNLPTKRLLDQTSKKCGRIWKISNVFFPQKLPRILRLRVSKIWRKFLLEGKKLLRIGKNSECLSFEKKFHILFRRTSIAVLPTLIKLFRHCPENFKNYPKILKFSRLPFGNVAL